jgi:hypothetical protein
MATKKKTVKKDMVINDDLTPEKVEEVIQEIVKDDPIISDVKDEVIDPCQGCEFEKKQNARFCGSCEIFKNRS